MGFIGKISDDKFGIKYEEGLKSESVKFFYSKKKEAIDTGTCLILVTPDSERTMCTFLGTAGKINDNDIKDHVFLISAASLSNLIVHQLYEMNDQNTYIDKSKNLLQRIILLLKIYVYTILRKNS